MAILFIAGYTVFSMKKKIDLIVLLILALLFILVNYNRDKLLRESWVRGDV